MWTLLKGECMSTLSGHTSSIFTLALAADDGLLFSGSGDHTIKIWNIRDRDAKCLQTLHSAHTASISRLLILPEQAQGKLTSEQKRVKLVSAGWDQTIKIWQQQEATSGQMLNWQCVRSIKTEHEGPMLALASMHTFKDNYVNNKNNMHTHVMSGAGEKLIKLWCI